MTKEKSWKYKVVTYFPAMAVAATLFFSYNCYSETINQKQISSVLSGEIQTISGKNKTILTNQEIVKSNPDSSEVFFVPEVMPSFPEGNLQAWISSHIVYPREAIIQRLEGKVYVQIVIEKDGSINNVKILRGADSLLNNEAVRVVKEMPRWTPGTIKGKPVAVSYTLPINFALNTKKQAPTYENHMQQLASVEELAKQRDYELVTSAPDQAIVEKMTKTFGSNENASEKIKLSYEKRSAKNEAIIKEKLAKLNFTQKEEKAILSALEKEMKDGAELVDKLAPKEFIKEFSRIDFRVLALKRERAIQKALGDNRYRTYVEGFYCQSKEQNNQQ